MLQIRLTSPLVTISLFTNQISFQDTAPDIQLTFLVAFMFAWIYFDVFGLIYWYIYLVDIFRWIYLVGYIWTSLIWISPQQYRSITLDWCIICFFSQARYLSTFGIFGFTSNYSWGGVWVSWISCLHVWSADHSHQKQG